MSRFLSTVADRILDRVAPKAVAGACIPDDPYYTCYNHAHMYCTNNCSGVYYCNQVGSC